MLEGTFYSRIGYATSWMDLHLARGSVFFTTSKKVLTIHHTL